MLRKIVAIILCAGCFIPAISQDTTAVVAEAEVKEEKKGFSISGSADVYYRYDFGKTKANNLTSFTNSHNSFELGMASVRLEQNFSKVSMVADLGFGRRAQEFSYNDEGALAAIKQLYVSYQPADWVKVSMGSWATHVGYELVDPFANRNYSMSYMFSYGPFFHTGVKAEFTKGNHGFMVGIANPNDYKFMPDDGLNRKFLLAQYSYSASDKFAVFVNYVGGDGLDSARGRQFDVVMTSQLTGKFGLGFNATVNTQNEKVNNKFEGIQEWWGAALYMNFSPTDKLGFCLRNEYVKGDNNRLVFADLPNGGSIFATTLSCNIKVADCFSIIPEVRMDNANVKIFESSKGMAVKSAGSALLACVYQF
jgi:hypothetical protein